MAKDNRPGWEVQESATLLPAHLQQESHSGLDVLLLPERFDLVGFPNAVLNVHTPTVRTVLRNQGVSTRVLQGSDPSKYRENRSANWIGPTLLIGWPLYSSNPNVVSLVINLLSSYIYDLLSPLRPSAEVELECIVEVSPTGTCKRVPYKGPASKLSDVSKVIKILR